MTIIFIVVCRLHAPHPEKHWLLGFLQVLTTKLLIKIKSFFEAEFPHHPNKHLYVALARPMTDWEIHWIQAARYLVKVISSFTAEDLQLFSQWSESLQQITVGDFQVRKFQNKDYLQQQKLMDLNTKVTLFLCAPRHSRCMSRYCSHCSISCKM